MQRVCFVMQVKPDLIEEYRRVHEEVWPSMLRAIQQAGRQNYSLFLREDGLLVGYYEAEDPAATTLRLAEDPATAEWENRAKRYFVNLHGDRPDLAAPPLHEVFNLDDQLTRGDVAHRGAS